MASGIREVVLIVSPQNRKDFERYVRVGKKKFPHLRFHVREQATLGGEWPCARAGL